MHEILVQLGTTVILFAIIIGAMWGTGHWLKKISKDNPVDEWRPE